MAYSYEEIIAAQYQTILQQRAQANADLEAARMSDDAYNILDASNRIVDADIRRDKVDHIAQQFARSQQAAPQSNKYGLSPDELDIARTHAQGDRSMTDEQRLETYARNKARYQQARRDGSYRDDQGRVFK